jgi:hypothetical protein
MELAPNTVLTGPFWGEPVRVLMAQPLGEGRVRIEAVGLHSQRYIAQILGPTELALVQAGKEAVRDFTGDAKAAFFAVEAARIRFAYQFDPHSPSTSPRWTPAPPDRGGLPLHSTQPPPALPPGRRPWRGQDHHGRPAAERAQVPRPGNPHPHRRPRAPQGPVAAGVEGEVR